MAKTKTKPETVDLQTHVAPDSLLEALAGSWPHELALRCDHAGVQLRDGHEPDAGIDETPDGQHLIRARYLNRCSRFGRVETTTLFGVDDPERACPECDFFRTIVGLAG